MPEEKETLSGQELRVIANLTVELTRLRQNECKHQAVENFAPTLFYKICLYFCWLKDGITPPRDIMMELFNPEEKKEEE